MATAPVTSDPQLDFPPKGSLRRFPFARLVREIARNKLTGSLYLLSGQTKKVVFFEEGAPVFVRSNVLSECLGQVLSSEGLITQEQCEQTLEAIRRTGKKQGELLVEMGILSEGNLRYGLEAQLRYKLFDIFAWDDGRYQFKTDPPNLQFGVRLGLSAEGVIIGAIQDRYSKERAVKELTPYEDKYPVLLGSVSEREGDLDLLPEEFYFVQCLDGSRTVSEVVENDGQYPVLTPHALLFGLLQAGLVQLSDQPLPAKSRPSAPQVTPNPPPDAELAPKFEAQDVVTEYEDTPLPGELPKVRGLLGDHEADFAGVEDEDASASAEKVRVEVSQALVAAEPEQIEETFGSDQIELNADEDLEEIDLDALETSDEPDLGFGPHDASTLTGEGGSDQTELSAGSSTRADVTAPDLTEVDEAPEPPARLTPAHEPALDPAETIDAELLESHPGDGEIEAIGDDLTAPDELEDLVDVDEVDLAVDVDELGDVDLPGADGLDGDLSADLDADLGAEDGLEDVDAVELPPIDEDLVPEDELDDLALSVDADLALDPAPQQDALVDFDELDNIELTDGVPEDPVSYDGPEATAREDDNPEMVGAIRFNEAETALEEGDHARAVTLLEEAYDNGFDVAELHAMLAYARFMASGQDQATADHAFELLDYAQNMDPSLDLVHAYRGAIFQALQQPQQAREALDRALELNPYCELAIELMDQL